MMARLRELARTLARSGIWIAGSGLIAATAACAVLACSTAWQLGASALTGGVLVTGLGAWLVLAQDRRIRRFVALAVIPQPAPAEELPDLQLASMGELEIIAATGSAVDLPPESAATAPIGEGLG